MEVEQISVGAYLVVIAFLASKTAHQGRSFHITEDQQYRVMIRAFGAKQRESPEVLEEPFPRSFRSFYLNRD